jgi:hypothetical protein
MYHRVYAARHRPVADPVRTEKKSTELGTAGMESRHGRSSILSHLSAFSRSEPAQVSRVIQIDSDSARTKSLPNGTSAFSGNTEYAASSKSVVRLGPIFEMTRRLLVQYAN